MVKKVGKIRPKSKGPAKKTAQEKADLKAQKNEMKKLAEREALVLKRLQKGAWNIPDIAQEFDTS